MANLSTFLIVTLSLVEFMVRLLVCGSECGVSSSGRILNLSINSKRNQTGEWVTTFSARKDSNDTPNNINLDVTHKFVECDGKHTVHIQGVIREMAIEHHEDKLLFHANCGSNARVSNDGRSAEKINLDDAFNGVLITNKPLRINEMFQVRLDKKLTKFTDLIGIGATTHSPADLQIPNHMNNVKSGTWMMYLGNVYQNGTAIKSNYMKPLKDLNVGDKVGITRKETGILHIFVNGIDQGPAASNVPHSIYGVLELYCNAAKVTIIDAL